MVSALGRLLSYTKCKPNNVTESFEGLPQWHEGRPTLLTNDEERVIVRALIKLGEWRFAVVRMQCTTLYNCSESGWMEGQQFLEWFSKVFAAGTSNLDGPKLLIFDGHSSHISPHVVDLAVQNNIELLCLPAHTSSIFQALDVGVFKAVRGA